MALNMRNLKSTRLYSNGHWSRFKISYFKNYFSSYPKYKNSNSSKTYKEVVIPVPWGNVSGKWWGPTDKKPIICLHGFQDNCGTFDRLLPYLDKNISFLALDLPGHGYSSHYPDGMIYHFLKYILFVRIVHSYFNWPTIALMGHSFGAMVSFMYNMLYPEKVDFLICFDAIYPLNSPVSAERLKEGFERLIKYQDYKIHNIEPLSYTTEEILEKVVSAHNNSIKPEYAHHLIERNISPSKSSPGKYFFTRDPRMKVILTFNVPKTQLFEDCARIKNPIFLCKIERENKSLEFFHDFWDILKKNSTDVHLFTFKGTHHLHLNEPEKLEPHLNDFLEKYYIIQPSNLHNKLSIFDTSEKSSIEFKSKI